MVLRQFAKPWYVWRPWQLVRRASVALKAPASGYVRLPVAWGISLIADPAKVIGRSIFTTGIHDLAVSEVLARLIRPGDTVVDAGANVGYMTLLAGIAAGPSGRVLSWEPHPELFSILRQNVVSLAARGGAADIAITEAALGPGRGRAELVLPAHMVTNDGVSYIGVAGGSERSVSVAVETIDEAVGGQAVSLMKLDVEGAELGVLIGARNALGEGRITHLVFEDHVGRESPVARLLTANGYRILSVGWSVRGLHLSEDPSQQLAAPYEAPSFIATLDPDFVYNACSASGWTTLNAGFSAGLGPQRASA